MNVTPPTAQGQLAVRGNSYTAKEFAKRLGTVDRVEIVANLPGIRQYGIPAFDMPGPEGYTVRADDGLDWLICEPIDNIWVHARRDRTPEEREAYIDSTNMQVTSSFFSVDRQHAMDVIALAMLDTYKRTIDPRKYKRQRRQLRRKLLVFSSLLRKLAADPELGTMKFVRETLQELGVDLPQVDFIHRGEVH